MVEKKLQQYYWIIGVIGLTFTILIIAIFFAIIPSLNSINKTGSELSDKKQELKMKEDKLAKLKELKVKEDDLKKQSYIVYRAIPTKKEIGDIFIELNGLVKEAGGIGTKSTSSSSSSSDSPSTSAFMSQVPTGVNTLTFETDVTFPDYQNFKNLITNSEKALRFVHLDNFKVSGSGPFTVNLTYTGYYRNEIDNNQGEQ